MHNFTIKEVEAFWNSHPCGLSETSGINNKKFVFEQTEKERYAKQARILSYADFPSHRGKRVLEVGCGIGTDAIQFTRYRALYTGVDLTQAAVDITKERLKLFRQSGEILKINAEKLPFPDNYFDHVYSFGVIHHSSNPEKIVEEIYRVLKPDGSITVMLYNRTSFYYLIEVCIIRKISFKICHKKELLRKAFTLFNSKLQERFELYRAKLAQMKRLNPAPTSHEWVSMNTDDIFCPIARVYSKAEAKRLFRRFTDFKTEVWFIDRDNWFIWLVLGFFLPRLIVNWLEFNFGWFRMILAKK